MSIPELESDDVDAPSDNFVIASLDVANRGDARYLTKRGGWSIYAENARRFRTHDDAQAVASTIAAPDSLHRSPTPMVVIID